MLFVGCCSSFELFRSLCSFVVCGLLVAWYDLLVVCGLLLDVVYWSLIVDRCVFWCA